MGRFLKISPLAFWLISGCAHRVEVESVPVEAKVYGLNSDGMRTKLLGHTPLKLTELEGGAKGIEVESPGHISQRYMIPFGLGQDFRIRLNLPKLDTGWLQGLPPEILRGAVDSLAAELFQFQSELFATSVDDAQKLIDARSKRLGSLASFHEILGNYWFFNARYVDAAKSFSRVLDLNPKHEEARKMLVLTDVRSVNRTLLARSKAFTELRAAAGEIAEQANGWAVKTKSQPNLTEPDGFEMVLPSDLLFRPTTARFTKVATATLKKLAGELARMQQGLAITVEAHTDSDMGAELENSPGVVLGGQAPFKSLWELSSTRAAAVMEFLRNESVMAERWNIAGYADTRPIKVAVAPNKPATVPEKALNRRVVIRVQLLGDEKKETVLTQAEANRIRARLAEFLAQEDEDAGVRRRIPRPQGPVQTARPILEETPEPAAMNAVGSSSSRTSVRLNAASTPAPAPTAVPSATPTAAPSRPAGPPPNPVRPRLPRLVLPGG